VTHDLVPLERTGTSRVWQIVHIFELVAARIEQHLVRPVQTFYLRHKNDHSVATSGEKYSVGVKAETVGISFQGASLNPNRPFRAVPPKIVPPADDGKIHFQPLTLKWGGDIV
jgi:hypothetical protein